MNRRAAQHRLLQILLLSAVCVVQSGCRPLRSGGSQRAEIVFANESFDQADVYASSDGGRPIRIGTVMSNRTETLVVPSALVGHGTNVNISARLLAKSRTAQSGYIRLSAGDRLQIRLPPDQRSLIVLPDRDR